MRDVLRPLELMLLCLAGVLTERTLRDAARRARGEEVVSHS